MVPSNNEFFTISFNKNRNLNKKILDTYGNKESFLLPFKYPTFQDDWTPKTKIPPRIMKDYLSRFLDDFKTVVEDYKKNWKNSSKNPLNSLQDAKKDYKAFLSETSLFELAVHVFGKYEIGVHVEFIKQLLNGILQTIKLYSPGIKISEDILDKLYLRNYFDYLFHVEPYPFQMIFSIFAKLSYCDRIDREFLEFLRLVFREYAEKKDIQDDFEVMKKMIFEIGKKSMTIHGKNFELICFLTADDLIAVEDFKSKFEMYTSLFPFKLDNIEELQLFLEV